MSALFFISCILLSKTANFWYRKIRGAEGDFSAQNPQTANDGGRFRRFSASFAICQLILRAKFFRNAKQPANIEVSRVFDKNRKMKPNRVEIIVLLGFWEGRRAKCEPIFVKTAPENRKNRERGGNPGGGLIQSFQD